MGFFFVLETGEYHETESSASVAESLIVDYAEDSLLMVWNYAMNGAKLEEMNTSPDGEEDTDEGLEAATVDFSEVLDLQLFFTSFLE